MSLNGQPEEAAAAPVPLVPVFSVAQGKTITSRRGALHGGTTVSPGDFPGGDETIDQLVKAGVLDRS